jgi:TPP-dependent pyruvate/acetoin dehydrogenase alpha subunit
MEDRTAGLTPPQLLEMYRKMCVIRRFDEEAAALSRKNLIHGVVHSYIGEEAAAVGMCAALQPTDYITSTHRGHGHCLAKGGDPQRMMAEILGRVTGYCKGKGGSMHIADLDLGILGANGIVGGGFGIATGAAFTSRYRNDGRVAVCFFGDGALHQGVFYECANMAALWKLPIIYLCEYNGFAEFTHSAANFPIADLTTRAAPFGFPAVIVDGNDVLAVYRAARDAVQRARQGDGPTLLFGITYRIEGHYVGDPLTYRTKEEVVPWQGRDPLTRFRGFLQEQGLLPESAGQQIEAEVSTQIREAIDFAMASPEPGLSELTSDVYATTYPR